MTLRTAALASIAVALTVLACSGGQDDTSNLPTDATLSPTAEPTSLPQATVAPQPDTGIPEIDAVVDAVESRDIEALVSLIRATRVPCTTTIGQLTLEPPCPADTVDGSIIDAFHVVNCEVGFVPIDHAIELMFREYGAIFLPTSTIYGVYRPPSSSSFGGGMSSYAIVLSFEMADSSDPFGWMLIVEDGLVGVDSGCVRSPEHLIEDNRLTDPLLTPRD